jgi:MoaA/NifB/PqqE/SkfB family radical SAM enzyme
MDELSTVYIRVHGMPCVNRCRHCWTYGSPGGSFMDEDSIFLMLDRAADLKSETGMDVFPQFFQEPTLHPAIIDIVKRQWELDLTLGDCTWFSTNGYGIARFSDDEMGRFADTGVTGICFTLYGVGEVHDSYAGRSGAWNDIEIAARRLDQFGIEWSAGVIIHPGNVDSYNEIEYAVNSWGSPSCKTGWMMPQWAGRARLEPERATIDQIEYILSPRRRSVWKSEARHVSEILSDPRLNERPVKYDKCSIAHLDVYDDLTVCYGGGCDSSPFEAGGETTKLGDLRIEEFLPSVQRYLDAPPEEVRLLAGVTWGELALRYGDSENQEVFYGPNLVIGKWGEMYLKENLDKLK